jgi:hypothetical protein
MNKINNILKSVIFRRILVIFVVGLVSRSLVNLVFDINVFKDYTEAISLIYYGFMACFSGFVQGLPQISFNVFKFNLVKSAIRNVVSDISSLFSDKMLSNDRMFIDNFNIAKINDNSVYKQDSSDKIRYGTNGTINKFKSAGVRGLYGNSNRDIVGGNLENKFKSAGVRGLYGDFNRDIVGGNLENKDYSFRNGIKCRVMWSVWKKFTSEYVSYKDYSESFSSKQKVSIINEIKRSIHKKK